jgi:hypothetical protein
MTCGEFFNSPGMRRRQKYHYQIILNLAFPQGRKRKIILKQPSHPAHPAHPADEDSYCFESLSPLLLGGTSHRVSQARPGGNRFLFFSAIQWEKARNESRPAVHWRIPETLQPSPVIAQVAISSLVMV